MVAYLLHNNARLAFQQTKAKHNKDEKPDLFFLPGFRSDMNGIKASAIAEWAEKNGHGMTRFDYSGHGQSDGTFADGGISQWLADALAIFDTISDGKQILIGSSMGGWIMLHIALLRPDRISGLVGIAAAPDFTEELIWNVLPESAKQKLQQDGVIYKPSGYSPEPTPFTRRLIEEGRNHLLFPRAELPIHCPVRLIHGEGDSDVPWRFSSRILDKIQSADKRLHLIKDGDHRLNRTEDISVILQSIKELSEI